MALVVVALALLATPFQLSEPDTLSRLAIGRHIVLHGFAEVDPRGYGVEARVRWSNPEWLGDLALYGSFELAGERGVALFGVAVIAVGIALLALAATRRGADPRLALALLAVVLPALAGRLTARNEMHLYWLAGAQLLLLARARESAARWPLWVVAGLAALWANLHSSFVVGLALVLVVAIDSERPRTRRHLLLLAALHPLLWLASPQGFAVYAQAWRHVVGARALREQLVEWQSAWRSPLLLAVLAPLLLICVLVLAHGEAKRRKPWGSALFAAVVVAAALASRRLAVLAALAGALLAAPLSARLLPRARTLSLLVALAASLPVLVLGRANARSRLAAQQAAPPEALLSTLAARQAKVLVPYNSAPWFLWRCPGLALFADPRNARGLAPLQAYRALLVAPAHLDATRTDVVVTDGGLASWRALIAHLRSSPRWRRRTSFGRWSVFVRSARAAAPSAEGS